MTAETAVTAAAATTSQIGHGDSVGKGTTSSARCHPAATANTAGATTYTKGHGSSSRRSEECGAGHNKECHCFGYYTPVTMYHWRESSDDNMRTSSATCNNNKC